MPDPFQKHGIDHLSVSSLKLWWNEPARWVAHYLYGVKDQRRPAAWRGDAVEAGLNHILAGMDDDNAILQAQETFLLNAAGTEVEGVEQIVGTIPDMVRQVGANLRPLGRPLTTQRRVERRLPGIEAPLIGYVDYEWEDFIVDLKTTMRMPAEPRGDDVVQAVSYGDALDKRPGLIYVTPKKLQRYTTEHMDQDAARWKLRRAALALRLHLEVAADREEMASLTVPKFDDFRWSPEAKEAAKGIWT